MEHNKAFTMAEVLITLGIVGIIAAITIPNLMGAYRKKVVETELQRAFSIISQTIRMSEVKNESAAYWSYPTIGAGSSIAGIQQNEEFINLYIKPYIKYLKTEKETVKVYYSDGTESYYRNYINKVPQFILADGLFLAFMPRTGDTRGYVMTVFVGTTNMRKKDEFVEGKNLFAFTVNTDEEFSSKVGLEPQWYLNWSCQNLAANRRNYIDNCYKNQRELSGIPSSIYCTYMIYCNNWTVPDDYPIKL